MSDIPGIDVLRALGDDHRLRAALVLRRHELCVCQIVELLQLAPSTVSKHLAILKDAGLVESRKRGRWVYYRAARKAALPTRVVNTIMTAFDETEQSRMDSRTLDQLLSMDPEKLCEKQRCP